MKTRLAAAFAALCLATAAQAADPTATSLTPGSRSPSTAEPHPSGQGQVDATRCTSSTSWSAHSARPGTSSSIRGTGRLAATITFDAAITGVFFTKASLDGSNATYGAPGITYGTSLLIGLEARRIVFLRRQRADDRLARQRPGRSHPRLHPGDGGARARDLRAVHGRAAGRRLHRPAPRPSLAWTDYIEA